MLQGSENKMANKNENKEKEFPKTCINWYPGHMAKTKKQIIEDLKLIDVVAEIIDSRIPISSQNPDIKEIVKDKTRLIILNKSDLASEEQNKKWVNYFEEHKIPAVLVDSNSGKGIPEAIEKITQIYDEGKYQSKGRIGKSIRVMILGIPNVGKSSFINRVAKRNTAQVGNKPGVTRQKQWIRVSDQIELLDTPGVLWPKLENNKVALNLAYTGTIKEDILSTLDIGYELLKILQNRYIQNLQERYKLQENEVKAIIQNNNLEENEKTLQLLNLIGKKRGAIITGGEVDQERAAKILLDDFRSGKLGKITLEFASGDGAEW